MAPILILSAGPMKACIVYTSDVKTEVFVVNWQLQG
jgi:hypothetical protein